MKEQVNASVAEAPMSKGIPSKRIEFKTLDGITLRGDYYRAPGENRPIVVMHPGLALLKEHFMGGFARKFNEAGFSALAFDFRTWGSSDGTPRQHASLLQQGEDFRDAVSAAMKLPGVNPAKIIILGLGHSGASALIAAADDPRLAAVVLQSPIISGKNDSKAFPNNWQENAWKERQERSQDAGVELQYVGVFPKTEDEPDQKEQTLFRNGLAHGFFTEAIIASDAAGTPYENKITLQSLLAVAATESVDFIHKIAQPTLYVVFPADPFTGTAEYHKTGFDRMTGNNNEFRIVEPPADTNIEGFVTSTADAIVEFLKRVL